MTITLELDDDVAQQLSELAQQRGLTLEELVTEILLDYIERHQKGEIDNNGQPVE